MLLSEVISQITVNKHKFQHIAIRNDFSIVSSEVRMREAAWLLEQTWRSGMTSHHVHVRMISDEGDGEGTLRAHCQKW